MELRVYAEGISFRKNSDLKPLLDLMNSYEVTYSYCLGKSAVFHDIEASLQPRLKLTSFNHGSIDIRLITEVATAVAPVAPQLFGYAWQLYKSGFDLVSIATRYFKREGKPAMINIENSPGVMINIINGEQVSVNRDVYDTASGNHKSFNKIASLIKNGLAEIISIGYKENEVVGQIEFNRSNQDDFYLPKTDIFEAEPIEFECTIYRFNKKSLNGTLEFNDQNETLIRPFKISRDIINDCIEALKAPSAKVTAYRELEKNALGESKIKKFHIDSISPIS